MAGKGPVKWCTCSLAMRRSSRHCFRAGSGTILADAGWIARVVRTMGLSASGTARYDGHFLTRNA